MANAIQQTAKGLVYGLATLPPGETVKQAVHDGDTVRVSLDGSFSVRFLGIDTPEVSFTLPGTDNFLPIGNQRWQQFLTDPFAPQYGPFSRLEPDGVTKIEGSAETILGGELLHDLRARLGPECATNHAAHAEAAHRRLEKLIQDDVNERQQQGRPYRFFLAFSHTVVDRYGRLLAFVHRDETRQERQGRSSYNERLLADGLASPYFIWPNIDPFRVQASRRAAVPRPDQLAAWLTTGDGQKLETVRQAVGEARQAGKGIYGTVGTHSKLALLPFELRYLAGRRAPDRYVLDLSTAGTVRANILFDPRTYHRIPNPEDRLFIDADDVLLFLNRGYVVES